MNQQHTVQSFDTELKELDRLVIAMGRAVIDQHEAASRLQQKRDPGLAQQIIDTDRSIDEMQSAIEEKAIQTIAKRQPVAVDLRTIIAILKIATDLERIGDLVKNNAKRMLASSGQALLPVAAANLDTMSTRVAEQVERTIDAFQRRDDALAMQVWQQDVEIDTLQMSLFRELLTYMMEDPRSIGYCTHLLFCSRNLERIGDHATNIAEQIHYIITGETMPFDRPKGNSTETLERSK